jgi:hypothetical protein
MLRNTHQGCRYSFEDAVAQMVLAQELLDVLDGVQP